MVLPSIGSQLNYAVCRQGKNPVFVQSFTGWALRRPLVSCFFLGLPVGITLRASFLYLPLEKQRHRLTVACFATLQFACAWLLISLKLRVRNALSMHPHQPSVAEVLFVLHCLELLQNTTIGFTMNCVFVNMFHTTHCFIPIKKI